MTNQKPQIINPASKKEIPIENFKLTDSTRFKLSVFSTIILVIVGIFAYIYNPENIDKFAFYTINMVLPIISYIVGRTIRSGKHTKGFATNNGLRYRTSLISFLGSLTIGIVCYVVSPDNIDKLGMYMIGVILPIVGFIIGASFKKSEQKIYEHDYDGYSNYYSGNNSGGGYGGMNGNYGSMDMSNYGRSSVNYSGTSSYNEGGDLDIEGDKTGGDYTIDH